MRRILLAVGAAAIVSGCAELGLVPVEAPTPPPPAPVLRAERFSSATFASALIARRKVDGLRVEAFVVGEAEVQGSLLSELKSPKSRLKPPVPVFAVRHPRQGVILFGAGLPEGFESPRPKRNAREPLWIFKERPGGDLVSRLEARSIKPEEVKWVVLPDIAPQWAGRLGAFPNASILASYPAWLDSKRKEVEVGLPDPQRLVPEERLKTVDFSTAAPFGPFEHGQDLFSDGTVVLVDLEGGTAGGMGLWVNLDSGPVLFTGPAAFVYDNIFDAALPDRRFVVDVSSFAWNARAMRSAQEAVPRLIIVPAYDLNALKFDPRPDITIVP